MKGLFSTGKVRKTLNSPDVVIKLLLERVSAFSVLNFGELAMIKGNVNEMLNAQIISLEEISSLHPAVARKVFGNNYGKQALREHLFLLQEVVVIHELTFNRLMTEQGLVFIKNIKGKFSAKDLNFIPLDQLDEIIRSGYIEKNKMEEFKINAVIQDLVQHLKRFYGSYITDANLLKIQNNLHDATFLSLNDLQNITHTYQLKNFFGAYYFYLKQGVTNGLFNFKDALESYCINDNIEKLLTEDGISFLAHTKDKVSLIDLVSLHPSQLDNAIEKGDISADDVAQLLYETERADAEVIERDLARRVASNSRRGCSIS